MPGPPRPPHKHVPRVLSPPAHTDVSSRFFRQLQGGNLRSYRVYAASRGAGLQVLASAIQQVQREIRIQEQRLSRLGISYTPRAEPNLPGLRLPESVAREPAPTPVSVPVHVPQPEPQEVEPPVPERVPPPQPVAAEPNDPIRDMREQIRQLRAELTAAQQKRQVPEIRTSAKIGSAVDRGAERRRQRLEAVSDQLRDSPAPAYRDNPHSVGSADRGWQPNTGW
jgi:hypothetical protein